MEYLFSKDVEAICEILGITIDELALELGVQNNTLIRNTEGRTSPSDNLLESLYGYAFDKKINLGRLKEMMWSEAITSEHSLLVHGAKDKIDGEVSVSRSRINNDFGQGFYCGDSYDQAVSFVAGFDHPSVYFIDFDGRDLNFRNYEVDQEWILTIAYYRGTLKEYVKHPYIQKLIKRVESCDYVIAPIADNRMFQIINSFISGEITDEQCRHCLAATNLGKQYVFRSEKAVNNIRLLERSYLSKSEKNYYLARKEKEAKLGEDKVKISRIQYRGKGKYIDELFR